MLTRRLWDPLWKFGGTSWVSRKHNCILTWVTMLDSLNGFAFAFGVNSFDGFAFTFGFSSLEEVHGFSGLYLNNRTMQY
jgi:hypothetical protein